MTRYTNIGRKRTFLQAGFDDNDEPNTIQDAIIETQAVATPAQKKRKRSKKKSKSNEAGIESESKDVDASAEASKSEKPVKNKAKKPKGKRPKGVFQSHSTSAPTSQTRQVSLLGELPQSSGDGNE